MLVPVKEVVLLAGNKTFETLWQSKPRTTMKTFILPTR
jgi:hypothetical protein